MNSESAVHIRNAHKSYGQKDVLNDFSMTVPKGCIYGLLGSSGCGKTTLLSCISGRKQFNSGELWVLGGKPGTVGSGVPGPRVGYMPQEIALVGEFTISDAVYYFGRLANKDDSEISKNFTELKKLLDLPPDDRYIKNCSGGQQRRVSFAAALIHKPELLILDEPTVGVDPLLRERIWNYLIQLTKKENTAVIITTHYIEETRQANMIGLMRNGKLLTESSPNELLREFNTESLEDVFLVLSQKQEEGLLETRAIDVGQFDSSISLETINGGNNRSSEVLSPKIHTKKAARVSGLELNRKRMRALISKNWKQFYRNISGWIFLMFFPLVEILAFLLAVGPEIKNVPIAFVNNEKTDCKNFNISALPFTVDEDRNCHVHDLSCRFLTYLDHSMLKMYEENDIDSALDGIHHGKYVGAIYFTENFTESLEERFNYGPDTNDDAVNSSEIKTYLDMSNRQVGYTIKFKLMDLFIDFQKSVYEDCGFHSKHAKIPVNFADPVYGSDQDQFTEFMAPGILITVAFFSGALLTSQIILTERLEGVWDRSAVAGVTALEITLSHFIIQLGVIILQTFEIFALVFFYYGVVNIGNPWILYSILLFEGLVGMACGFWVSMVSVNHSMSNIVTTGIFYPMILLCGILWPLEGQPQLLRIFAKCLPFTIPIQSMRNVFMKGWDLSNLEVLDGIGVQFLWFSVLTTICIYSLKKTQ